MPKRSHVALLRGINVGGHNRIAMADLRELVAELGHTEVATYVQSGNVVFAAANPNRDAGALAKDIEQAIAERLGLTPAVVVVTAAELARVARENPFPGEPNPKAVHAFFYPPAGEPAPEAVAEAERRARDKGSPEQARLVGPTLYLWTPDGLGRSMLAAELARGGRSSPIVAATGRNWATVVALADLLG